MPVCLPAFLSARRGSPGIHTSSSSGWLFLAWPGVPREFFPRRWQGLRCSPGVARQPFGRPHGSPPWVAREVRTPAEGGAGEAPQAAGGVLPHGGAATCPGAPGDGAEPESNLGCCVCVVCVLSGSGAGL